MKFLENESPLKVTMYENATNAESRKDNNTVNITDMYVGFTADD
jgi:hypothetical protein